MKPNEHHVQGVVRGPSIGRVPRARAPAQQSAYFGTIWAWCRTISQRSPSYGTRQLTTGDLHGLLAESIISPTVRRGRQ